MQTINGHVLKHYSKDSTDWQMSKSAIGFDSYYMCLRCYNHFKTRDVTAATYQGLPLKLCTKSGKYNDEAPGIGDS